ncbi:MAG: ATP-binding protein [Saprospiraceae bacterium]
MYWDYFKFSTIIKNLISNALKFTYEKGHISVFTKIIDNTIVIEVKDDGQGIHTNDLPLIFNRYYQAKNTATIQEGGTGIGLAICNEYVKAMNGTIKVQSELGKGSVFTVMIPIVQNAEAMTSLFPVPIYETNNATLVKSMLNSTFPDLLLVEDNLDMQSYIKYLLKDNYNVNVVPHGKAALEFLEENNNIQLIITDLMMPEMNGHEFIKRLKNTPKYAAIPTIMLTALDDKKDKLQALRVGIDDYLTKPFLDEELMVRIDNLLENYQNKTEFIALEKAANNTVDRSSKTVTKDQEWLEKLEETTLENLQNTNYSIDALTQDMLLSRVQFYRKLKVLTGLTPKKYIDEIRFQKAREILESRSLYTIKAVALRVGFKDEKHFSRNFKKRFGKYPSEYLE